MRHLLNLVWPYDNLFYYHSNQIYWNCWEVEYLNDEGNYYLVHSLFLDYFVEWCYCDWNKYIYSRSIAHKIIFESRLFCWLTCYQDLKMVFDITSRRPESLKEWSPVSNFHEIVLCNVQWYLGVEIDLQSHWKAKIFFINFFIINSPCLIDISHNTSGLI